MSARVTHIRRLPLTRGECIDGPRPCPHTTCRYHLGEEETSCVLDIADRGGETTRAIGSLLGISFARVQQIERSALIKVGQRKGLAPFSESDRPSEVRLRSPRASTLAAADDEEDDQELPLFEVETEDPWTSAAWRALQRMGRR